MEALVRTVPACRITSLESLRGIGGILCHGCFDVLHLGHVRLFHRARALAPELVPLIVTITADAYVKKGPGRPVFNQDVRAEMLAAIRVVDYVAIVDEPTAISAIQTLRPLFMVKGSEYEGGVGVTAQERHMLEAYGGRLVHNSERLARSSDLVEQL